MRCITNVSNSLIMMRRVLDIVNRNLFKVNINDEIKKIKMIFYRENFDCAAVYDNENLVGVLTMRDLLVAPSDGKIMDIMTNRYLYTDCRNYVWKVKYIYDSRKELDVIFVKSKRNIIGYISRTDINIELGRHIDLLTGLYKNEYLFYNMYKKIKSGQSASLIFIDIDKFGYIDKEYGHIYGDIVLRNIADILKESISEDMFLSRYAGDEFVILNSYDIDSCNKLASKLSENIKNSKLPNQIEISASIGIATYDCIDRYKNSIMNIIKSLVNTASLASTIAKKNKPISISIKKLEIWINDYIKWYLFGWWFYGNRSKISSHHC